MNKPDYKMPIERNKGNGQKTKGIPANLKVDGYDSLISQFKMKANGNFTMFDNDILEELPRCKIRLEATKTYLWLYRKLIGYHKIIDRISLSQIEEGTGLSKRSVPRALEELLKHNMIIKIKVHGNNYYGLTSVEIWTSRAALKLADKKMIQGELFTSDMPRVAQICATSAGDKRKKKTYIKKSLNARASEGHGLCKMTKQGLTKEDVLRHVAINYCNDNYTACPDDCVVWPRYNLIKLDALLSGKKIEDIDAEIANIRMVIGNSNKKMINNNAAG